LRVERTSAGWNVDDTARLPPLPFEPLLFELLLFELLLFELLLFELLLFELLGLISSGSTRDAVASGLPDELLDAVLLPAEAGFSIRTPEPEPQRSFKRWKNEPLLTMRA